MTEAIFANSFWGERNQGFEVLLHNLKSGQKASSDLMDFLRDCLSMQDQLQKSLHKLANKASNLASPNSSNYGGSFSPSWLTVKQLLEKQATIHLDLHQQWLSLQKTIQRYSEEQIRRHREFREGESSTQEIVTIFQKSCLELNRARDIYYTRVADLKKLRPNLGEDNSQNTGFQHHHGVNPGLSVNNSSITGSNNSTSNSKDIEKCENRLKKAKNDYKYMIERYNNSRQSFIEKMGHSTSHFQEVERTHLEQMLDFLQRFGMSWLHILGESKRTIDEYEDNIKDLSVSALLSQFATERGTGGTPPLKMRFEDGLGSARTSIDQADEGTTDDLITLSARGSLDVTSESMASNTFAAPRKNNLGLNLDMFRNSTGLGILNSDPARRSVTPGFQASSGNASSANSNVINADSHSASGSAVGFTSSLFNTSSTHSTSGVPSNSRTSLFKISRTRRTNGSGGNNSAGEPSSAGWRSHTPQERPVDSEGYSLPDEEVRSMPGAAPSSTGHQPGSSDSDNSETEDLEGSTSFNSKAPFKVVIRPISSTDDSEIQKATANENVEDFALATFSQPPPPSGGGRISKGRVTPSNGSNRRPASLINGITDLRRQSKRKNSESPELSEESSPANQKVSFPVDFSFSQEDFSRTIDPNRSLSNKVDPNVPWSNSWASPAKIQNNSQPAPFLPPRPRAKSADLFGDGESAAQAPSIPPSLPPSLPPLLPSNLPSSFPPSLPPPPPPINLSHLSNKQLNPVLEVDEVSTENSARSVQQINESPLPRISQLDSQPVSQPSPANNLTLPVPLAVATTEIYNARFVGSYAKPVSCSVNGELSLAFLSSIVQSLMDHEVLPVLEFYIVDPRGELTNFTWDARYFKECRQEQDEQMHFIINTSNLKDWMMRKLSSLSSEASISSTQRSTSRYFHVELLKYQVRVPAEILVSEISGVGAEYQSSDSMEHRLAPPLTLRSKWTHLEDRNRLKLELSLDLRRPISSDLLISCNLPLQDVKSVEDLPSGLDLSLTSEPEGQIKSNQVEWLFSGSKSTIENRLNLEATFSIVCSASDSFPENDKISLKPQLINIKFSYMSSQLSESSFEVANSNYRLALSKRRLISGQYLVEPEPET